MGHYCCFKNCKNSSRKTNCRFFRFPVKHADRTMKWIERSGNESLYKLSNASLTTKHVCSAHFDVDQILGTGRLFFNSIPNSYTETTGAAANDGESTGASMPSQTSAERNAVPPFIVVHETIDFVVDLIDEDVDDDELTEEEADASEADGLSAAECGEVLMASDEPAAEPENLEVDPLAMETDDSPLDNAPHNPQLFTNSDAASTAKAFDNNIVHQRDHSVTEVFHIIETVMDEPPSSGAQETPGPWCVIRDLQENPFCHLPRQEKREVVALGRPTPAMELCGTGQVHFGKDEYDRHTWVTGSTVLRKIFCWPCLLFFEDGKNLEWTREGFGGHPGLDADLLAHENSNIHIQNSVQLAMLKNIKRKDSRFGETSAHNENVKKKREVLQRMIDSVCLLAKMKIPCRSHYDTNTSLLHSTYLALVYTLGEFDHPLRNHLDTKNINTLTCSRIRNALTVSITAVLLKKIKQEIKEAKFVSIILCQMSSSTNGSQLATVVRYVDQQGHPCERFIRFEDVGSGSGVFERGLSVIARIVEEFEIQSKLVAISYSGQLIGLCDNIKERYPGVLVINNHSDQLSSDLLKVCWSMKECHLYLTTMSSIAKFFSDETTVSKLNFFIKNQYSWLISPKVQFSAFWGKTASEFLPQLLAFFKNVTENPKNWPSKVLLKVQGYRCFLEDFANTFLLVVFARVFTQTHELNDVLQKKEIDLGYSETKFCLEKLRRIEVFLENERDAFDDVWDHVRVKREHCNLEPESLQLKNKVIATYSRKPTEEEDPRKPYKLLFSKIMVCVSNHIADLHEYLDMLHLNSLINLEEVDRFNEHFPSKSLQVLTQVYPDLFHETHLMEQLAALYQIKEFKGVPRLELIPHMKRLDVQNVMPEVYSLACLCLTIPGAKPLREISFSATNRIKYVCESLGQHQKSNLAQLSIENQFLCELKKEPAFYSEVLDEFAKQESSMEFTYLI